MTRKKKDCNCEFCIKCDSCGHTADSHVAGDGNCMTKGCECSGHISWVVMIWERMTQAQRDEFDSFLHFADKMIEVKNMIVRNLNDDSDEPVNVAVVIMDDDSDLEHQAVLEDFQDDIIH